MNVAWGRLPSRAPKRAALSFWRVFLCTKKTATRRPPILGNSKATARTTAKGESAVITNNVTNETLRLH
jgi:hypothetical protein